MTFPRYSRSKYGNKRVKADGITFDSQAEFRRYRELKLMQSAGIISGLEVHRRFELIAGIKYEADFVYLERGAPTLTVEDVKGAITAEFRIKAKLFKHFYPELKFLVIEADKIKR